MGINVSKAQTVYLTDARAAFSTKIWIDSGFNHSDLRIFDGEYYIYFNEKLKYNHFKVHIINNAIDGYTIEYDSLGNIKTAGYYYCDSLWTCITNPGDTTFKAGTWLHQFNNHFWRTKHNIPKALIKKGYKDIFAIYSNGTAAREIVYDTNFNVLETKIYYANGTIRSFAKMLNDSTIYFIRYYKNGTILYQVIDRPSLRIEYRSILNNPELIVYKCDTNDVLEMKNYHLSYPGRGYDILRIHQNKADKIQMDIYRSLFGKYRRFSF